MPFSQTHLSAVCELLDTPGLTERFPWLNQEEVISVFLAGAIAPDTRVISHAPREKTHLFRIPLQNNLSATDLLLHHCPTLADPASLTHEHAAFVAGYITHLVMDMAWVEEVVTPCLYIEGEPWGPGHPYWRLYNILMTYLEYHASQHLPRNTAGRLAGVRPLGWCPLISDKDLSYWFSFIAEVISGGGVSYMIALQARTLNMDEGALAAIVCSPAQVQAESTPVDIMQYLERFYRAAAERSRAEIFRYLDPLARPATRAVS